MKLLNADISSCLRNVAVDTTRLICHYFFPIPPFLYCLVPKLALMVFSLLLHGCHGLISLLHVICALYKTTLLIYVTM